MSRFIPIAFAAQIFGGAAFFGLIYSASLERQVKVLCCLGLILITFMSWAWFAQWIASLSFELRYRRALLEILDGLRSHQDSTQSMAVLREQLDRGWRDVDRRWETKYLWFFAAMLAFWIVGGIFVAEFLP